MGFRSIVLVLFCAACAPSVDIDASETASQRRSAPRVEFDPGAGIVPFPTDLLPRHTNGRLALPAPACESATQTTLREGVLNTLNGFGTWHPALTFTLTGPVDADTLAEHIVLVPMRHGASPIPAAAATPVSVLALSGESTRPGASCSNLVPVYNVTLLPAEPLEQNTTYAAIVLQGLAQADGTPYLASTTFGLVRQSLPPVEVDGDTIVTNNTPFDETQPDEHQKLLGLATLWQAHAPLLSFAEVQGGLRLNGTTTLPVRRDQILLAWSFTTATVTQPLDPGVPGSLAAGLGLATTDAAAIASNVTLEADIIARFESELAVGVCETLACDQVGAVVDGTFIAPNYQTTLQNGAPGPFDDPYTPSEQNASTIKFIAIVPRADFQPEEVNARPTVIFGHGIARSKDDLFAMGAQLAAVGISSVAMDWVNHGERAVKIIAGAGCSSSANPITSPQCFAPIFSADLLTTRDNLRQSALDLLKFVRVLKTCGPGPTAPCEELRVDPVRIGFLGQSMGGIIGSLAVATSSDLKTAVLNVAATSWLDVVFNSPSDGLRCPLVDALIDQGVLVGNKWNGNLGAGALCKTETWKSDPAFLAFANAARWVLDPAESANYVYRLRSGHRVLLQEVLNDATMPNSATEQLAQMLGLVAVQAHVPGGLNDIEASGQPAGGAAAESNAWVLYKDLVSVDYAHTSLIAPAANTNPAAHATAQMQYDAIHYLLSNLAEAL